MESKRAKAMVTSIAEFATKHAPEAELSENRYEELIGEMFKAMGDLKEPSHNNQSRLTVLR